MIPKLWSLLMLKLTRLIVRIDTARDARHQAELLMREIGESKNPEVNILWEAIKAKCEDCDYCEQCEFYFCFDGGECLFADSEKGIPCYWEV